MLCHFIYSYVGSKQTNCAGLMVQRQRLREIRCAEMARCGRRFSFIPSRYGAWRKHSPTTLPDQGRSVKDPVCHFILLRPLFHSSNRPAIAQWQ